ncbi:methyltransferase domain-containing protein [Maricaulis maris]|uniref:methyltransferase domain-containing protein n=1 Tax=Maricaulis maris TaxID=74318 RepID=UPI0002FB4B09|nr:methyltransferase domain-containing protein [Maricaulis maris]
MRRDVLELDRFYRSRQGQAAHRMIARRLSSIWPDVTALDVLGIGFANPYLDVWQGKARRCVSLTPAAQGAIVSGPSGVPTALGDETHLPFQEALFDRVLLVHALEETDSLPVLLREVWRVLAPEGRLLIVSPSRAGIWAWLDSTPFGHGRPFTRGQLTRLLDDALLVPTAWSRALYAPPWGWSTHRRVANLWEEVGEYAWPALGGLILVEAVKHNAAVTPGLRTARVSRTALEGQRQPALSPRHGARRARRD